ncbi:MAG: hypothetical protein PHD15_07300 [Clostridia bacterium]|nr:hypothetical protein [Tissierellia bacterium]MDD4387536.1 hypothetical protein [Clostridia bacterium]
MTKIKLIESKELKKYFIERGYNCIPPYQIANNNDTVFLTAGIQPLLSDYRIGKFNSDKYNKLYLSQPVIRTQYINGIKEGFSIAFINSTSAGFNISEEEHNKLVNDWIELFYLIGMTTDNISTISKDYVRDWGDLIVCGKKIFYYYNNIELGDTTFFDRIQRNGKSIGIDSMSDVGFGLERIRWCINNKSYYDIYSDSKQLDVEVKAYLSAIALLTVNNIVPTNKNSGYRARQFSKKLAVLLNGKKFSEEESKYLDECMLYWNDWQEKKEPSDMNIIKQEYVRNCNRFIIDKLIDEGYKNLNGININISREEMAKRLISSGVEKDNVKKLIR